MSIDDIFLLLLFISILIFGVVGNGFIIYYFWRKMEKVSSFRWFIIHLALADFICCLVSSIYFIYLISAHHVWYMGVTPCKMFSSIGPITVNASSWILVGIAYERYRAIIYPFKDRLTTSKINMICLVIWCCSLVVYIPYILAINVHDKACGSYWDNPSVELAVVVMMFFLQSVIPILLLAFFFVRMKRIIQGNAKKLSKEDKSKNRLDIPERTRLQSTSSTSQSKSRNTISTLLITVVIFTVCSLPYNLFYIVSVYYLQIKSTYEQFMQHIDLFQRLHFWLSLLVLSNSLMNCVIYAGKFKLFRVFLFSFVCRSKKVKKLDQMELTDTCHIRSRGCSEYSNRSVSFN